MRIDYIDPFIESAMSVLSEYTGTPVVRGAMELRRDLSSSRDVAVMIGMAGEVEGRVILDMDRETALRVAGIMNRETFRDMTGYVLDTLMEMANLVVAKAVTVLNGRGFVFRLTPPMILTGSSLSIAGFNLETLVVPLRFDSSELNLNVALRMKTL